MGKSTISMAIFNSYVSLPEGKRFAILRNGTFLLGRFLQISSDPIWIDSTFGRTRDAMFRRKQTCLSTKTYENIWPKVPLMLISRFQVLRFLRFFSSSQNYSPNLTFRLDSTWLIGSLIQSPPHWRWKKWPPKKWNPLDSWLRFHTYNIYHTYIYILYHITYSYRWISQELLCLHFDGREASKWCRESKELTVCCLRYGEQTVGMRAVQLHVFWYSISHIFWHSSSLMVSDDFKAPKPINVQIPCFGKSKFIIIPYHSFSCWIILGRGISCEKWSFQPHVWKTCSGALQVPLGPELNTSRPRRKPTGSWPGHVGHGGSNTQLTVSWLSFYGSIGPLVPPLVHFWPPEIGGGKTSWKFQRVNCHVSCLVLRHQL